MYRRRRQQQCLLSIRYSEAGKPGGVVPSINSRRTTEEECEFSMNRRGVSAVELQSAYIHACNCFYIGADLDFRLSTTAFELTMGGDLVLMPAKHSVRSSGSMKEPCFLAFCAQANFHTD